MVGNIRCVDTVNNRLEMIGRLEISTACCGLALVLLGCQVSIDAPASFADSMSIGGSASTDDSATGDDRFISDADGLDGHVELLDMMHLGDGEMGTAVEPDQMIVSDKDVSLFDASDMMVAPSDSSIALIADNSLPIDSSIADDMDSQPGCIPETEECNGLDDDCDNQIDESALGTGIACTVGVGSCRVASTVICDGSGVLSCDAQPSAPSTEQCDGLDNDCDGRSDEDFTTLGQRCVAGVGECRRYGLLVCSEDGTVGCNRLPRAASDEICDGLDNDCDGSTDEGFRRGEPCINGIGECARSGSLDCDVDGNVVCVGSIGNAEPEGLREPSNCDNRDNDCDGRIDEDYGQCCANGRWNGLCSMIPN